MIIVFLTEAAPLVRLFCGKNMPALTRHQKFILQSEFANDPLTRGYDVMNTQQKIDSLLTINRTRSRRIMSAGEILEQIDFTEFNAKTDEQKNSVDRILGLGSEVIVGPGNNHNAVQELIAVFTTGSNTITNLSNSRDTSINRAEELGIPIPNVNLSVISRI